MQQQNPRAAPILCQDSVEKQQQESSDSPSSCTCPVVTLGMSGWEWWWTFGSHKIQERNAIQSKTKLLVWADSDTSLLQHCQPWAYKNCGVRHQNHEMYQKKITAYGRLLLFGTARLGKCRSCIFKPFPFLLLKWGGFELCSYFCKRDSQKIL